MKQKEFFGFNSVESLKDILLEYKASKIFLVVGKGSFVKSSAESVLLPMFEDLDIKKFNDFSVNPDMQDVKKGIKSYKSFNPDIVVAVGGGSVIDIAKSINILSFQSSSPEKYIKNKLPLSRPGKPFVAIPTTSGTGSEATYFATIYSNKIKFSIGDKKLTLPDIAIVDPQFTMSMPSNLTASTGLDALCQGIESMWAVGSTDESRHYAKKAVKKAFDNLEKAVNNPNKISRMNMAEAANFSGKAICISKTTACHSISYPITSFFKIPHGHAVALSVPEIIEYNYNLTEKDCIDPRGVDFVKEKISEIFEIIGADDEIDAKGKITRLIRNIGLETRFNNLNISKKDLNVIIKNGFTPSRMSNNPRKIDENDLRIILERIL